MGVSVGVRMVAGGNHDVCECVHLCPCRLPNIIQVSVQMWVYVLSESIMPFQHYREGVPSATNVVPDHGVNNLILTLQCIKLRDCTCTISTHSLSLGQAERKRMNLQKVTNVAFISSHFQNPSNILINVFGNKYHFTLNTIN